MQAPRRRGSIGPTPILDMGTRWWVVSVTFRPPFTPGKWPRYTLDKTLGGPQSWSGHRGWRNNSLLFWGLKLSRPDCSQTLYWPGFPSFVENISTSTLKTQRYFSCSALEKQFKCSTYWFIWYLHKHVFFTLLLIFRAMSYCSTD
jgi:hypothetical protein